MIQFGSNAMMCKIKYINRQTIDSTTNVSAVIGKAFHTALETYYGGNDSMPVGDEQEAIQAGLIVGMSFIDTHPDGFIKWSVGTTNKQKAQEVFAFLFKSYVKEIPYNNGDEILATEENITELVDVEWRKKRVALPVKLKGVMDKIIRRDGLIRIVDYKTVKAFSKPDKIDGAKIIAAVHYYFLVSAKYGEEPYSMIYEEVKTSQNRDKSPQVQQYEIVYADNELFFDFYLRYYEDVTRALNGEQVYVPNVHDIYDSDISIIAYAHRLDDDAEVAKQMKKHKVDNITDLLKKKIQKATSMKKFLAIVEREFIGVKNLNYAKMKNEEKIQTKLMEHGMMLQFESVTRGHTFDLYRYTPSIGLKMRKISDYTADIEQVLGVSGVRILAPIPDSSHVGFEIPKKDRTFPAQAPKSKGLRVAVGVDIHGATQYLDIAEAPHLLIAGTTGSGKSWLLNSILRSIGGSAELWLMDPKRVELQDIPNHRYGDTTAEIVGMLQELSEIMFDRYATMKTKKQKLWDGKKIVAVIDEFGDLMLSGKDHAKRDKASSSIKRAAYKEGAKVVAREAAKHGMGVIDTKVDTRGIVEDMPVEDMIVRIAQLGRAAGIHLIIATQSPRVTVLSGRIKANFPTRIALRVSSEVESRIILDERGAEKLIGKGDMIVSSSEGMMRLQGFSI